MRATKEVMEKEEEKGEEKGEEEGQEEERPHQSQFADAGGWDICREGRTTHIVSCKSKALSMVCACALLRQNMKWRRKRGHRTLSET